MGRCARCKKESSPRHKYKRSGVAGVYCSTCLSIIMGESIGGKRWWQPFANKIRNALERIIHPRTKRIELRENAKSKQLTSKTKVIKTQRHEGTFRPRHLR